MQTDESQIAGGRPKLEEGTDPRRAVPRRVHERGTAEGRHRHARTGGHVGQAGQLRQAVDGMPIRRFLQHDDVGFEAGQERADERHAATSAKTDVVADDPKRHSRQSLRAQQHVWLDLKCGAQIQEPRGHGLEADRAAGNGLRLPACGIE